MTKPRSPVRCRHPGPWWLALALLMGALLVSACQGLGLADPLRVSVAGVEPLPGEGLELRFLVRLRVQNPNGTNIEYDGVALDLAVDGKSLASGVSDERGSVPRFGEVVLGVPVTVSAIALVRQAIGLGNAGVTTELPYELSGKLGGELFGTVRFAQSGTLKLPR